MKKEDMNSANSRLVLVADIGGTNANFAVFDGPALQISANFKSGEIENFTDFIEKLIQNFNKEFSSSIGSVCIAAAGPISKNKKFCKLTNLQWSIDVDDIQKRTGLDKAVLINDFEAIAHGIDVIDKKNIIQIKKGEIEKRGTRVLLGAGTGLGKCTLISDEHTEKYRPIMSELGHVNASLSSGEDFQLARFIQKKDKKEMVSWQDILSGRGIKNIYQFLQSTKTPISKYGKEIINSDYDQSLISKYKYADELAGQTFQMFTKYYARCAKIVAMDSLAFGGVFIAGGIAAKNRDIFTREEFGFNKEFLDVRKLKEVLESIPVYVIDDYGVGLYGSASLLGA